MSIFHWLTTLSLADHGLDPEHVLLSPRKVNPKIERGLFNKIIVCLSTRYSRNMGTVRRYVSQNDIVLYGRLRCNGDTIIASSMNKRLQEDQRDATYVRVSVQSRLVLFTLLKHHAV